MLNFKDMIKVQRVMWIKRLLLGESEMKWKEYFEYIFQSIGGKFIFLCNYDMHDIYVQAPPLYLEYLRIWQDMKENRVVIKDPENQIFYNNTLIRFGRKTIFNRKIFKVNIFLIKHIVDREGKLKPVTYFLKKGLDAKDLFEIHKIYSALPENWKVKWKGDEKVNEKIDYTNLAFKMGDRIIFYEGLSSKMCYHLCRNNVRISFYLNIRE